MKAKLAVILTLYVTIVDAGTIRDTPESINNVSQAWVELFDDKDCKDSVLTVNGERNISNLKKVKWDNGKKHPGDRISAVRYQIPLGWKVVLFDDHDYKDSSFPLIGTGKVVENCDLGSFSDKASSLRWERSPQ